MTSTFYGFTPDGFAKALDQFGANLRPYVYNGLKRGGGAVKAIYLTLSSQRGVVKAIWGSDRERLARYVKMRTTDTGSGWRLRMEIKGLPALQEAGGHTKPPRKGAIYPRAGKVLAMRTGSGITFAAYAKHRGANIARRPVAQQAMVLASPRIAEGLDYWIKAALAKAGIEAA